MIEPASTRVNGEPSTEVLSLRPYGTAMVKMLVLPPMNRQKEKIGATKDPTAGCLSKAAATGTGEAASKGSSTAAGAKKATAAEQVSNLPVAGKATRTTKVKTRLVKLMETECSTNGECKKRKIPESEPETTKKTREGSSPKKNKKPVLGGGPKLAAQETGRAASPELAEMRDSDEEVDLTNPLVMDLGEDEPAAAGAGPTDITAVVAEVAATGTDTDAREDDGAEETEWQAVPSRNKNVKKDGEQSANRLSRRDSDKLTVFVSGKRGSNLVRDVAYKNADAFKSAIHTAVGAIDKLMVVKSSIKVTCKTEQQAQSLLQITSLLGHGVTVTVPRRLMGRANGQQGGVEPDRLVRGVIKRVPPFVTTEQVAKDTGAVWAHRIEKLVGGTKRATRAVVVAFKSQLPTTVSVGLNEFKVHVYVPQPLRCIKCQRFGHKAAQCGETTPTCPRCSGAHIVGSCTVSDAIGRKCANCGENHSAAYRGCKRFQQVNKTLTVSARQNMSYADAAKQLAKHQRETKKSVAVPQGEDKETTVTSVQKPTVEKPPADKPRSIATQTETCADGATQTAGDVQQSAVSLAQLSELLQPLLMTVYYLFAAPQIPAEQGVATRELALGQLHNAARALGLDSVLAERRRHASGPPTLLAAHARPAAGEVASGGENSVRSAAATRQHVPAVANDQAMSDKTAARPQSGGARAGGSTPPRVDGQRSTAAAAVCDQNGCIH